MAKCVRCGSLRAEAKVKLKIDRRTGGSEFEWPVCNGCSFVISREGAAAIRATFIPEESR